MRIMLQINPPFLKKKVKTEKRAKKEKIEKQTASSKQQTGRGKFLSYYFILTKIEFSRWKHV